MLTDTIQIENLNTKENQKPTSSINKSESCTNNHNITMRSSKQMNELINRMLFEEILKKNVNRTVKVVHVDDIYNIANGVNIFSELFKVRVVYTHLLIGGQLSQEKIIDLVVKAEPTNNISLNIVRGKKMFQCELRMLKDVLPRIENLVNCEIGPRLLYGSSSLKILIMEDLSAKGYLMKDQRKGLSFYYCKLVLEQLARLHAGSVALHEKEPHLLEWFKNHGSLLSSFPTNFIRFLEIALLNLSKEVQTWSDVTPKYKQIAFKLNKLSKTIEKRCKELKTFYDDEFCVLNHADCWINNMMFKENASGTPDTILIVDYQTVLYSSPAMDLHYFLNTCPEGELRYEMDEIFLDTYLNTLKSTMESIQCVTKAPTLETLKKSMHRMRLNSVITAIIYFKMMSNKAEIEDLEEIFNKLKKDIKMNVFKNEETLKLAQRILPIMNERGYFD